MHSTLSSIISLTSLISFANSATESSPIATAHFSRENNGIEGSVMVVDGNVEVYIDISELDLTNVVDNCFANGLTYHIHELWEHNDLNDRVGSDCGRGFTGNHWDPWVACGPATDNNFCINDGGCVTGSSVLGNELFGYNCNPNTFSLNPYVCEVGDWGGKYGRLTVGDEYTIMSSVSSPYEVSANDLKNFSVVFHCNDGSRVFCAPFVVQQDLRLAYGRPEQSDNEDLVGYFDVLDKYSSSSSSTSMVVLGNDGKVSVNLNIGNLDTSVCDGNDLALRIYNYKSFHSYIYSSSLSFTSECEYIVDEFYDPTQSCAPESDSEFCINEKLCGINGTGEYSCNFNEPADRFLCAPGDITGKFGTFNKNEDYALLNVFDPLLIDLSLVKDKSIVLQCADNYKILACAELRPLAPQEVETCNFSPCLEYESGNCKVYNDGSGCSQCEDDSFKISNNHPCSKCINIVGPSCKFCQNNQGCGQCIDSNKFYLVTDDNTGLRYCEPQPCFNPLNNCRVCNNGLCSQCNDGFTLNSDRKSCSNNN